MTPEFEALIQSYPEVSEETIKLIFLRDASKKAYIEGEIASNTGRVLQEIIELGTIASKSKDEIGIHIGNLEKCRAFISCMIQGYKIAHAEELEPKFKAQYEEKQREKRTGITKKSLEDKLAQFGLGLNDWQSRALKSDPPETPKDLPTVICPKCKGETFSLMFHSCKVC
jgi:hypothetical protein